MAAVGLLEIAVIDFQNQEEIQMKRNFTRSYLESILIYLIIIICLIMDDR